MTRGSRDLCCAACGALLHPETMEIHHETYTREVRPGRTETVARRVAYCKARNWCEMRVAYDGYVDQVELRKN